MKKRLTALFLAALTVVMLLPFNAYAKGSTEVYDYYSKKGKYAVSSFTFTLKENEFTYKVWYPKNIKKMSKRPVILYCNGTGSNYEMDNLTSEFLTIAASHGYICLTNTDKNTGMGTSMDAGFTKLTELNKTKSSKVYGKVNINKVGLAGHSQGATCTVNMSNIETYENAKYYKAIFAASLPTPALENSPIQNCPYDTTKVTIPTLMTAGTGGTDSSFIAPWDTSLYPNFQNIKSDVYLARMKDVQHADSNEKTFPYMIAWFDYQFYGKKFAAKAFRGKNAELKKNPQWQDFKVKIRKKEQKLTSAKGAKKAIKVKWKADKRVSGYQIQYATNEDFENAKSVKVVGAKTTSKTVKKLKAKKTYYVRVRAYTVVAKKTFYSKWSAPTPTKTK